MCFETSLNEIQEFPFSVNTPCNTASSFAMRKHNVNDNCRTMEKMLIRIGQHVKMFAPVSVDPATEDF